MPPLDQQENLAAAIRRRREELANYQYGNILAPVNADQPRVVAGVAAQQLANLAARNNWYNAQMWEVLGANMAFRGEQAPLPERIPERIPPQIVKNVEPEEEGVFVNKFLVGCDPEFVAVNDGKAIDLRRQFADNGQIGWDHNGDVGELRPEPAKGTYTLLKRIKQLIFAPLLLNLEAKKIYAGAQVGCRRNHAFPGNGVTLGGHVHLDLTPYSPEGRFVSKDHLARIKALDTFTRRLEALDIIPHVDCEKRREIAHNMGQAYGDFGDYRVNKNKDNTFRFEYRTMPSWLYSPKVAFVCMTGAKLAAAAPQDTVDLLGRFHDFASIKKLFEAFAPKDANAKRIAERLVKVTDMQGDPDQDVREAWKELGV